MRLSHIAWNLAGLSIPLLVAAVSVPALIATIGSERFGLLALAWGLIGYAGALDLGIGRALTQMVARLRGGQDFSKIPDVIATAGRITLISGVVGGLLIAVAALVGGASWVTLHETPMHEVVYGMLLLAVALPAQAMSATYKGVNEAYQNFKGISLLRVGLGMVTFGGPYLVAQYTQALPWLVATLVASRISALVIFRYLAQSCVVDAGLGVRPGIYRKSIAKSLFSFGGWITVSSVVSPILVQADRFAIASLISASAVTIYVLPYEVVVQTLIFSGAISSTIFPSLSKMLVDKEVNWRPYFSKWLGVVAGLMLVVCSVLFFILPVLLKLWIGGRLNPQSILVGQILCVGVFANSIGAMFYALLHARGRADITARLHIFELPVFIAFLFVFLKFYGIQGAAIAWVGRMVVDAAFLAWFGWRK